MMLMTQMKTPQLACLLPLVEAKTCIKIQPIDFASRASAHATAIVQHLLLFTKSSPSLHPCELGWQ